MFHIKNLFLVYLIVPFISSCILSLFQEGNILSHFYGYLYFFVNKGYNHYTLTMICQIVMAINLELQKPL